MLMRQTKVESLNHSMLLAYRVSTTLKPFFLLAIYVFFSLTVFLSSQFLNTLNQTYIATHGLVKKGDVYQGKFLKAVKEFKKGKELKKNWRKRPKLQTRIRPQWRASLPRPRLRIRSYELSLKDRKMTSKPCKETLSL